VRRFLGVFAAATAAFGIVGTTVEAAPRTVSVFHFRGRAGSAVLTDCPTGAPAGTHCRAIDVFAFEQRVNEDGQRMRGPGLNVTLFDVELLAADPFFIATPVGAGFTDAATVRIASTLARGSAAAVDVALCETFDCAPGAATTLSLDVSWDGVGPTSRFRSHEQSTDPFCTTTSHSSGSFRAAEATGHLDGVEVVEPPADLGFQSSLQTDSFGSVSRCTTT
jgi:hypothetical protein